MPDGPRCDARCALPHAANGWLVLADLELEPTPRRGDDWWNRQHPAPLEHEPQWLAVRPAEADTPPDRRLPSATRLRRLGATDRAWQIMAFPGDLAIEALYEILDGPFAGGQLVAIQEGPSDIHRGLAAKLIVFDHPPAHDAGVPEARLKRMREAVAAGLALEVREPG